ncbi:cob(II)yrinic acid a,c-diamide reductase [Pararhizobium capsulatum DSM 1112]|uniref:Cob(II)yrinic acid a,c-diamide reductase n=1 Tax=Pararhizobium capsulatum DSM 1112 TaxID=1121113 RepID=A0ABU0BQD6_9HYPH|nr:cob(II)yrinic acid a,c-diamide reductase [Pararhizobium capsulatum DSM 1112]
MLQTLALDPVSYRDAMSQLAGHVHIVTTAEGEARRGVTITAACSVSDDPATLLVCLNQANVRNDIFLTSGCFALNVLGADQIGLANVFSGREPIEPEYRFDHGDWGTLLTGAPSLNGAMAVFDCEVIDVKRIATHMVLFGKVVAMQTAEAREALVYLNRGYRSV